MIKRLLAFVLVLAAVCSFSAFAVSAEQNIYILGDADGDWTVSISDATMVQRLLASIEKDPDGEIARRADVNGDGLSIADATDIQRYLANFENTYGIGAIVVPTQPSTEATFKPDPYELPFIPIL